MFFIFVLQTISQFFLNTQQCPQHSELRLCSWAMSVASQSWYAGSQVPQTNYRGVKGDLHCLPFHIPHLVEANETRNRNRSRDFPICWNLTLEKIIVERYSEVNPLIFFLTPFKLDSWYYSNCSALVRWSWSTGSKWLKGKIPAYEFEFPSGWISSIHKHDGPCILLAHTRLL